MVITHNFLIMKLLKRSKFNEMASGLVKLINNSLKF